VSDFLSMPPCAHPGEIDDPLQTRVGGVRGILPLCLSGHGIVLFAGGLCGWMPPCNKLKKECCVRKRASLINDLLAIATRLPWWLGVALAVVSYFGLHHFAEQEVNTAIKHSSQMVDVVTGTLIKTFARAGQYLLPCVFLLGASMSAYRAMANSKLLIRATRPDAAAAIDGMRWHEFEALVGEGYRHQGYSVKHSGGNGPDGGIDLVLSKGGEQHFVQCKQWRANKVGVAVVRELYGVMSAKGAAGGMVVTSGAFTSDAQAFAKGRNIQLLDGPQLLKLLKLSRQGDGTPLPSFFPEQEKATQALTPSCPQCKSRMVLRRARQGKNAGQAFWGCGTYPKCKGTLPLSNWV
jgi:restriction system protein